VIILCNFIVGV